MIKAWKSFSIFAVLALLMLSVPVVISAPVGSVAANGGGVVQEVEASFSFNETSDGEWHNFTAGSAGIDAEGLYLAQFSRIGVNRSVALPGCQFRNYTAANGTVSGDLNGTMWISWLTFKFDQTYPGDLYYSGATDFGFMTGRGHFYDTDPSNNFTFVCILDFDSNDNMSAAGGKGFMLSVNETGTFAGHKVIGDFDISKSDLTYTGNFHLRNYDPSEVYDLGNQTVTGGIIQDLTDPIRNGTDLLDFTSDGPQPTPTNWTTDFEEIAWGREPIKNVTSGHMGVNGTMDLSRNTALYVELKLFKLPFGAVRIMGTTANNLYINDTDTGVRHGDGSNYGELWEILLLFIPDQEPNLTSPPEYFEQYGHTFAPFGMLRDATGCYAGTEFFGLDHIMIEATIGPIGLYTLVDHWYGLCPHPRVTSVSPNSGFPGETLDVTIKGNYFLRADDFAPNTGSVSFGSGITVNSYTIKNSSPIDNEITASITIDPGASNGTRDINVTSCFGYANGSGTTPYQSGVLASAFTVSPLTGATLQGEVAFWWSCPSNECIESFNVTLFEAGNLSHVLWNGSAITRTTGVFTITGLSPGIYDIGIKNWTCLSKLETNITLTADNTTPVDFGTIHEGDANNDDWITIKDCSLLFASYGTQEGDAKWNAHCDFNRDGWINGYDLSHMYAHWAQHGDLVYGGQQPTGDGWGFEIQPNMTEVGFGENFTVNVTAVRYSGDADCWAMYLLFNTTYLEVTGIDTPDPLPPNGETPFLVLDMPDLNNTVGWAQHGYGIELGSTNYINQTFDYCTINFTSKANAGTTYVNFTTTDPAHATEIIFNGTDHLNWSYVTNGTVVIGPPTLMVDVSPAGKGDVNISGVIPSSYPNATTWSWDEVVNLTAVASAPNWTFDHWSGDIGGSDNPTNVTMDSSKSVVAHFARYSLTVTNTTGGTVTQPGLGTFRYPETENVTLVATNYIGYHFLNWTGDVGTIDDVDSATTNITMDGDYSIVANFAKPLMNCTCGDICVNATGWWHDGGTFNASSTPIQDAVNNATAGDTICVKDGTYHENVDVGTAYLTIKSENGVASCVVNASNPDAYVFNVTADWVNITGFTMENATGDGKAGIYLDNVQHCNISTNNASNNYDGIYLYCSSNNTLTNNTACNNTNYGIYLNESSHNTLTNNTAADNTECNIYLYSSPGNTLNGGNEMLGTDHGLCVGSNTTLDDWIQDIDTSNTVNGKPVYYLVDKANQVIDSSSNAGYVGVVNSTNITVKDLILSNNGQGILMCYTNNSRIENVTVSNNNQGIYLYSSSNNTLTNNTASNNNRGIYLEGSGSNTLTENTMSGNVYNFEVVGQQPSDYIQDIDTSNEVDGNPICYWVNRQNEQVPHDAGYVGILNSTNITVRDLVLTNNREGVLFVHTNNSRIENVTASNNDYGIYLSCSSNNTVTNNTLWNNDYGIYVDPSSDNTICNNYFNNTNNAYDDGTNTWNTTNTTGPNIIGGPYLGGNYWSDYSGVDTNGDGFGDMPYNIEGGANKDYLPLILTGTLEGNVDLQGLPATNITVRFFAPNTTTEYVAMKTHTTADGNGNFTIGGITVGTYDVAVKGQTSLSNLVTGVNLTDGNTTVVDFGVLLEGDALSSNDDYIDLSDYGPLSDAWLSYPSCPGGNWNPDVDFSRDDYIDMSDYGPLSDNWLKWGDCFGWPGDWL